MEYENGKMENGKGEMYNWGNGKWEMEDEQETNKWTFGNITNGKQIVGNVKTETVK